MTEDNDDEDFKPFVLRAYSGVLAIEPVLEAAERRPAPKWCDEYDRAEAMADAVCRRLLGIGLKDTQFAKNPYGDRAENERRLDAWDDALRGLPPVEGDAEDLAERWLEWGWE